jgi:hypothetical protein
MSKLWLLLLTTGCLGERDVVPSWVDDANNDLTGGGGGEDIVPDEVECGEGDTGEQPEGFAVSGNIEDLATGLGPQNPEALCAFALDPTPVLSGGEATTMAASKVCENGDYFVPGLKNPPSIGMFISIADCDASKPTVMKSATGVDFDDVKDLGDGDEYEGHTAYLVTLDYGVSINDNFVDFDGDAVEDGFMAGFVMDVNRDYVSDAVLSCSRCADFYYLDTDASDGLFQTDGVRNTKTDANARAVFFAPKAPIFTYEADDGGSHTWEPQLFGSLPGYASFLLFDAIN